jgi:AcrR family transcriptional regulator
MGRTGRRPGRPDTREVILAAARDAFAERGYDGASIRHIAAAAAVDPALVHHYFGTKEGLFQAALQVPFDPSTVIPAALAGGVEGVGERLVLTLLGVWDGAAGGPAAAFMRTAVSNEAMSRMLREFLVKRIMRRIGKQLGLDPVEAPMRTNLIGSQMAGLILARYILKLEPIASAPPAQVAALVGPTIQRYATEPLPGLGRAP